MEKNDSPGNESLITFVSIKCKKITKNKKVVIISPLFPLSVNSPKCKDITFDITYTKEKQKILRSQQLEQTAIFAWWLDEIITDKNSCQLLINALIISALFPCLVCILSHCLWLFSGAVVRKISPHIMHAGCPFCFFLITVAIFTLPIWWAEQPAEPYQYWFSPLCLWIQMNVKKKQLSPPWKPQTSMWTV